MRTAGGQVVKHRPNPAHPQGRTALTEERLRFYARLLANARRDAVALAAYEMGDDSWSVGCRAYVFGKQRLKCVADSRNHPWLRVMDDNHHFVFLIGQVPVRLYRGSADEPTARTLRRQKAEAEQLGLALGTDAAEGLVFRLGAGGGPADPAGGVDRVVFLALPGEAVLAKCAWPVPLNPPAARGRPGVQLRLIEDDARDEGSPHPARGRGVRPGPTGLVSRRSEPGGRKAVG